MQLVARLLRCLLQIIEGVLLLRSRLNHLFNALRRQVDEVTCSLTARGHHIAGRRSAPGRAVHRVEPLPLFIVQRLVKPLKWRPDNLYGLDGRIQSLLGSIEATNRAGSPNLYYDSPRGGGGYSIAARGGNVAKTGQADREALAETNTAAIESC